MGFITWDSEKFSVDVKEMDEQHRKWIDIINRLHTSLIGQDLSVPPELAIREMIDYTKLHFKHEEDLMHDVQYPSFQKHKQEHENFIVKIDKLDQDINNGTNILKTQIMSILKNWLIDHICKMDKAYGAFISKSMRD